MKTGKGKSLEFLVFSAEMGAPVMIGRRVIHLFQIPEQFKQQLIQQVFDKEIPKEGCVSFIEFNKASVYVGMLQNKLIPCVSLEAKGHVSAVAAELQQRIKKYAAQFN